MCLEHGYIISSRAKPMKLGVLTTRVYHILLLSLEDEVLPLRRQLL